MMSSEHHVSCWILVMETYNFYRNNNRQYSHQISWQTSGNLTGVLPIPIMSPLSFQYPKCTRKHNVLMGISWTGYVRKIISLLLLCKSIFKCQLHANGIKASHYKKSCLVFSPKEILNFLYISGTGWYRMGQHFLTVHEIMPYHNKNNYYTTL